MIFDCPACASALIYNPTLGKMECLSCGNAYDMTNFDDKKETQELKRKELSLDEDMVEYNIYSCTACGAEIAVNGVESSTFCSYCGQPTIVFSRVSSSRKPKYIIPFEVTKEQAVASIRKRLSEGFFVPKEIQNFEIERVRGIYIPFWLYDIDYSDRQYLSGEVKSGKNTVTKYFFREAECSLHNLTLDASRQLNDESSQRLEPYNTFSLKEFDIGYLSGFYADCYDMDTDQLDELAVSRTKDLFDKEVEKTIQASSIKILKNDPEYHITNTEYALFPAWFLTFRYDNTPYTILVNGQSRKVVGAVPFDKPKVNVCFWLLGILSSLVTAGITYGLLLSESDEKGKIVMMLIFMAIFMFAVGLQKFSDIRKSIGLSKSSATNHYVKDRQEDH